MKKFFKVFVFFPQLYYNEKGLSLIPTGGTMKITIICDVFGEENNGTTITASRLIKGLEDRGHTVKVLSTFDSTNKEKFVTAKKRSFGPFNGYVAKNGVTLAVEEPDVIRNAVEGADLVHIMMPFTLGKHALPILKELGIPYTTAFHVQPENISCHFKMQNSKLVNNWLYHYLDKKLFKHSNYIHCPTQFIADELTKHGYKSKKYVISNGVSSAFYKEQVEKPEELKDKFCILFSGRYSSEKRHDLLIKAVAKSQYKDKIQLIFAGCGPKKEKLQKLGKSLPNPPIFAFFNKDQLRQTINYCDLYVHPADVEIEAISCLEAITCGLVPVISNSKKSATRFFALHKENSFEARNTTDLANKIDYWIEHSEEKEKVSKEYLEYAKQFELESCIDKMVEMFEDAIHEHQTKNL